jgi:hypothetical protein
MSQNTIMDWFMEPAINNVITHLYQYSYQSEAEPQLQREMPGTEGTFIHHSFMPQATSLWLTFSSFPVSYSA